MKILVGIDGGSQQPSALTLAAQLAHGGELVVATVYPWGRSATALGAAYAKTLEEGAAEILAKAEQQLAGVPLRTRAVADLHTGRALHRLAEELDADAIVIGACHRGNVGRAVLGGTGESVVHGSPRPVVVAPTDFAGDVEQPRHIAVAYDGGPEAEAALGWAVRLAEQTGARIEILTVSQFLPIAMYPGVATYPTDDLLRQLREEAERRMQAALEHAPDGTDGRVLDGSVVGALVDASRGADLLVAGSRGYGPVGSVLMGSVSRALMHQVACPVVILPRSATEEAPADVAEALSAAE